MCVCRLCSKENPPSARFCLWCGATMYTDSGTGLLPTKTLLDNGRYTIIKLLGQGGMGAVYKAQDLRDQQKVVAVKEMSQSGIAGQELQDAISAFTREAEMLMLLKHRSLPQVYHQFEENGRRYLLMDFIEGVTLEKLWESYQNQGKLIRIERVINISMQLCSVLDYLHRQQPPIIFRDLKPANIMINQQGRIYLIDFGIARLFKTGQEKDTVALGSPGYAAPEQYGRATSPQSDIYSLGAVLHQLLTGDDPAANPFRFKQVSVNLPALEDLISSMLEIDEIQRPSSMKSVGVALHSIAEEIKRSAAGTPRTTVSLQTGSTASSGKPISIYALVSDSSQDHQIWESIQEHLKSLIDAIPNVRIYHNIPQSHVIDHADLILFLLSEDFLASSTCMAEAQRAMERAIDPARTHKARISMLLSRSCSWLETSLAHIPLALPDVIMHPSLYAQEQRILEAAKSIRSQLVTLILQGMHAGPMSLLHWLLWELYGDGGSVCPFFVVGQYALKYIRPSAHAGVLFHLFDLQTRHAVASYSIESHNSARLADVLRVIAPNCTVPLDVQGTATRARAAKTAMR
jgi:serine/threonine protein kinase